VHVCGLVWAFFWGRLFRLVEARRAARIGLLLIALPHSLLNAIYAPDLGGRSSGAWESLIGRLWFPSASHATFLQVLLTLCIGSRYGMSLSGHWCISVAWSGPSMGGDSFDLLRRLPGPPHERTSASTRSFLQQPRHLSGPSNERTSALNEQTSASSASNSCLAVSNVLALPGVQWPTCNGSVLPACETACAHWG
jgi:hypothetical protein